MGVGLLSSWSIESQRSVPIDPAKMSVRNARAVDPKAKFSEGAA